MQAPRVAVILAAGLGSRLGLNIPKCLVKVGGQPIIKYMLDNLRGFDQVRIVVGFKAMEVMNVVKEMRRDVIFVHNRRYGETGNIYSAHLGTKDLRTPFYLIDGDLVIDQASFDNFVVVAENYQDNLVGITRAKSEEGVYVAVNQNSQIEKFSTEAAEDYEWGGVAYLKSITFDGARDGYIYRVLEKQLPLVSCALDMFEIDTPSDYREILSNFQSR